MLTSAGSNSTGSLGPQINHSSTIDYAHPQQPVNKGYNFYPRLAGSFKNNTISSGQINNSVAEIDQSACSMKSKEDF